jgi:hypothetical protein
MEQEQTGLQRSAIARGLEELRDALTPAEQDEVEDDDLSFVRKHRGLIVIGVMVGAMWIGIAGIVSAATRVPPPAESVLGFEQPARAPKLKVPIGPNEWPTIAIAPRQQTVKKRAPDVVPVKRARPRPQASVARHREH